MLIVEKKQCWSNDLVKLAMLLAHTTRDKLREDCGNTALTQITAAGTADVRKIVATAIKVVRAERGWDKLRKFTDIVSAVGK